MPMSSGGVPGRIAEELDMRTRVRLPPAFGNRRLTESRRSGYLAENRFTRMKLRPPSRSPALRLAALLAVASVCMGNPATAAGRRQFEITPATGFAGNTPVRDAIEGLLEALNGAISGVLGPGTSFPYPDNADHYQWHGNDTPFLPGMEGLYYRIRDSRFQLAVEGSTNLQWLGSNLILSEAKGAIGIQINLIHPEIPGVRLAVRISPLFVELAWFERLPEPPLDLRDDTPISEPSLPGEAAIIGSAMTLLLEKSFFGDNQAGIHIALRPGVDLSKREDGFSLETAEAVFFRFPLKNLGHTLFNMKAGESFELEARVSHLRRNTSILDLIGTARAQPGREGLMPDDLLQNTWEGALFLTWKR